MDLYEELVDVISRLTEARINYALCGGLAVAIHGYPRFTKDIDLLIHPDDLGRIRAVLAVGGYTVDAGRIPFAVGTPTERVIYRMSKVVAGDLLSVDLVLVSPVLAQVWADRERYSWQGREIAVVSAAGLALMKRVAGRPQDVVDLQQLGLTEDPGDATSDETS